MQRTQNVRGAAEQGQERSRKTERRLHLMQSRIRFSFLRQGGSGVFVKVQDRSEEYIEESQRAIQTRIGEHHNQARNRYTETAWGEHMKLHPTQQVGKDTIFTASLVTIEEKPTKRKVREALEIQHRQSSLNRNKGWAVN